MKSETPMHSTVIRKSSRVVPNPSSPPSAKSVARKQLNASKKVKMKDELSLKKQKDDLNIKSDNINSSKVAFHENKKSANVTEIQGLVVEQTIEPRQHERSVSMNSKCRQPDQNRINSS